ncbi:bifunctional lysylphosphatidylglycerol flippase/synthetase MprF [Psychrobacter sp. CAL346-MNA-CIBAN-0220]|uniref:bifunctional lysylphosphatidylglycerol flippase/synthetase MprF n=1 Tax=Psychrobacter sp. CAL346-MNA-CIBAN-0220 TaxID=3140457 RepID=UPI00333294F7
MNMMRIKIKWHWLIALVAIIIFTMASKSLYHLAHTLDVAQMKFIIMATPPLTMLKAIIVVVLAYLLLSIYDLISVRYINSDLSYPKILNTSLTAFSIGNTIGISMLSAGAVRFRYYGQKGIASDKIANIILLISLAFTYGTMSVISASLILSPHILAQIFAKIPFLSSLSLSVYRIFGVVVLLLITASIIYAGKVGRVFQIKQWRIQLPPAPVLIKLISVAVIDIALVAWVIYILIPKNVQVTFLEVFSASVQSIVAGLISSVPGGLGVFELSMVASLPKVDKTTLLSVLLLFRILYYFIPFVLGILSFVLHEAYIRSGINSTEKRKILPSKWVPQLLALATAGLGMTMLVLSILPPDADRELLLGEFIPIPIIEASYLLNTLMGFALIVLARGLYQRLNGAWHISIWLLGASIVTLLIKHLEIEVAIICTLLFGVAYFNRKYFSYQSNLTSLRLNSQTLILLSVFLISLFWVGMYVHRHEAYSPDLWWTVSGDGGARFLRSYAMLAILTIAYALFSLIRFKKPLPSLPTQVELAKAEQVTKQSAYSVANLSLLGDKQLLFSDSANSFIMYQTQGRSWIVMSDPIGDESEFAALIEKFIELCQSFGGTFVFYEVSNRHRQLFNANGIHLLKIGEEAIVDLDTFSLQGRKHSKFRQIVSRGIKDGLSFEVIPQDQVPAALDALKAISDLWLGDKKSAEKGFSLGYFDEDYLKFFDCAVVNYQNEIVAFANIWQSGQHNELSIDLMRYKAVHNNEGKEIKNMMDYLFVNLFMWGKVAGFHQFSLGMAPFTGLEAQTKPVVENDILDEVQQAVKQNTVENEHIETIAEAEVIGPRWRYVTNTVNRYGKTYYNFTGLRNFKEKYNPHWEPRYIGIETGLRAGMKPIKGLTDTTLLISGGLGSLVKK